MLGPNPKIDAQHKRVSGPLVVEDLRRCGMRAPVVAVGEGALGRWEAFREVLPAARHQRDWVTSWPTCSPGCQAVQAGARAALAEIRDAPVSSRH